MFKFEDLPAVVQHLAKLDDMCNIKADTFGELRWLGRRQYCPNSGSLLHRVTERMRNGCCEECRH